MYRGNVPPWWNGWDGGRNRGDRGRDIFGAPFGGPGHQHEHDMHHERANRMWENRQHKWKNDWSQQNANWENMWGGKGEFKLDIYDTLEAAQTEIPEDLYERVKNKLGDEIETLDI